LNSSERTPKRTWTSCREEVCPRASQMAGDHESPQVSSPGQPIQCAPGAPQNPPWESPLNVRRGRRAKKTFIGEDRGRRPLNAPLVCLIGFAKETPPAARHARHNRCPFQLEPRTDARFSILFPFLPGTCGSEGHGGWGIIFALSPVSGARAHLPLVLTHCAGPGRLRRQVWASMAAVKIALSPGSHADRSPAIPTLVQPLPSR